jgi:putative membrane-bound dehydrogenase-like protein
MCQRPCFAFALLTLGCCASAAEFSFESQKLTVPDGYTIQRVAGPELVDRPITMAFDETGALYVADSSGSNEKPDEQVKNPTHRVVKLEDKNNDGVFDKSTVYADKLPFPEGTMWLDGSLYVAAPPKIWKFTDADGDGVAERREVWFDGKTLTGCANDLHGPYAGPDGYIYWCKGAFAEQKHRLGDGREFVTRASHVFRARPDGSDMDVVMTGGMDNPVDIAFTSTGEMFVSGTFFVQPGNGKRDGILHAVHGGVWGKDHSAIEGHPRTGELMPIMTHLGPAAAAGLEMMRSDAHGLKGSLLCTQFNMRKVSRHQLVPEGATFRSIDTDFVVSDNVDFHPTDVVEDGDGSVLIADTGGWYRLCCPTSTMAKPAVLGSIYRVRKAGAPEVVDSRGHFVMSNSTKSDDLVGALEDSRPAYVSRAVAMLGKRGDVVALQRALKHASADVRTQGLWALARISGAEASAAIRTALSDADPGVRSLAARTVSLRRDIAATDYLITLLADTDAHVRRNAIAAIGRIGDARGIPALLKVDPKSDRFLQHALAYALYEIGDADALTRVGAGAPNHAKVALTMLSKGGGVKPLPPLPTIAPLVIPADPALLAKRKTRLDQFEGVVAKGDAGRGAEVFRQTKSMCTTCHAIGGVGGQIGPDLTKVGAIRTGRDLLEAIVYPSASFVRSYEPVILKTKAGDQFGILKQDGAQEVVLATATNPHVSIARGDVVGIQEAPASIMPEGFDGILSEQEVADLVAFLLTAK